MTCPSSVASSSYFLPAATLLHFQKKKITSTSKLNRPSLKIQLFKNVHQPVSLPGTLHKPGVVIQAGPATPLHIEP